MWSAGGLDDGTRFHTTHVRIPGLDAFAPGYVQPPGGSPEQIEVCAAEEELDEAGFPITASLTCGPLDLSIEPVAFSPVHLVDDDGSGPRHARFPRGPVPVRGGGRPQGRRLDRVEPAGLDLTRPGARR